MGPRRLTLAGKLHQSATDTLEFTFPRELAHFRSDWTSSRRVSSSSLCDVPGFIFGHNRSRGQYLRQFRPPINNPKDLALDGILASSSSQWYFRTLVTAPYSNPPHLKSLRISEFCLRRLGYSWIQCHITHMESLARFAFSDTSFSS